MHKLQQTDTELDNEMVNALKKRIGERRNAVIVSLLLFFKVESTLNPKSILILHTQRNIRLIFWQKKQQKGCLN